MSITSASLLERLRKASADSPDWRRFHEIYAPVVKTWLKQILSNLGELDDRAQDVLLVVVRELPKFERRRDGSFRAWLRLVTVNQCRAFFRSRKRQPSPADAETLDRLEDSASELAERWDREHDQFVTQKLFELVRGDFEPATWKAFLRFAIDEVPAAGVAAELGISENAVLLAKSRVLKRLRQEAGDFLT